MERNIRRNVVMATERMYAILRDNIFEMYKKNIYTYIYIYIYIINICI